jgi:hypothetical protein
MGEPSVVDPPTMLGRVVVVGRSTELEEGVVDRSTKPSELDDVDP